MRKLAAIVSAPFRALGRLLAKLAGLRGRARVAVYGGLLALAVFAVLVLRAGPDAEREVRATLEEYAEATRDKDYQRLCDELYARDLVERIRAAGLPCEVALRTGLENRQNPQLEVQAVEVSGDQALAKVRSSAAGEVPSVDTVRLVEQDGRWRVAALSEAGAGP